MKATISANGKTIKTEITEEQAKELGLIAKKRRVMNELSIEMDTIPLMCLVV